jgi:hypothetical protein
MYDEHTNFGNNIDLRLDSFDEDLGEFHLSKLTYVESICASYHQHNKIVLHVHCHRSPFYDCDPKVQEFNVKQENYAPSSGQQHSPVKQESTHRMMERSRHQVSHHLNHHSPVPLNRPVRNKQPSPSNWSRGSNSPISVYEDADFLVKNPDTIVTFGMETKQMRVDQLQSLAYTSIPEVSSIIKLLKSHNVGYKRGDNASTWYMKLHNFCNIIGVYLTPPKAMEKHSEMGREWDAGCLPHVLYARINKMEKVLAHIITSPDFFPSDMQDDLQLNPNPYNFLRLFMAVHSHSVPDLSDNVINRPGPLKNSQSLSQYALSWVNYFNDEMNVNGVRYTKYRQYGYFMKGLPARFSPLRKFLDMEFTPNHDKEDNIPITVELRNIPTTIQSLATFHGISISQSLSPVSHINKIDQPADDMDDCYNDPDIKALSSNKQVKKHGDKATLGSNDFPLKPALRGNLSNGVQCWLCDGPHTFRQCQELQRMKSVCIKRPNVLKHFQHMLLNKNSAAIKVLLDASEFFDDNEFQGIAGSADPNQGTDDTSDNHSDDDNGANAYVQHLGISDVNSDDDTLNLSPFQILALHDGTSQYIRSIASPNIHQLPSIRRSIPPNLVQVDGGADRSTTPHRELVHGLRPPRPDRGELTHIRDAGEHVHPILGYGHFQVRCLTHDSQPITIMVPCAYIPSIPSTLVNFRTMPNLLHVDESSNHVMNIAFAYLLLHDDVHHKPYKVTVPLLVHGARLYADVILERSHPNSQSINVMHQSLTSLGTIPMDPRIAIVSDEPSKLLWHARLGHLNFRSMASMHLYADGVPKFKHSHVSDNCAECLLSKLRRSPRGHGTIKSRATVHGQVLSADWGFICQNSSDTDRVLRLSSVYGDTSYLIFTCAYTGALYGVCAGSKSVPTKWLHTFFHRISTGARNTSKLVLVDRGSELGRSLEFKKIALFMVISCPHLVLIRAQ